MSNPDGRSSALAAACCGWIAAICVSTSPHSRPSPTMRSSPRTCPSTRRRRFTIFRSGAGTTRSATAPRHVLDQQQVVQREPRRQEPLADALTSVVRQAGSFVGVRE